MTRITVLVTLAFLGATLASADPVFAEEVTLIFGTGATPQTPVQANIYVPWTEAVNQAGKGVIRVDERDDQVVLNSSNFYNQITNNIVQIGFGALDYVVGKFPLSGVTALPIEFQSSEVASVAFWRLYKSGALDSEFNDVVPLYAVTYPPLWLSFRKPLANPEDLRGLKVVASSKLGARMIGLLGASPVSMTYQETYSALQRGTIDGISFPMAGIVTQKFGDLTSSHLALGLGTTTGMVFMTKQGYDALSPAARKVLEDNSGEAMCRKEGALFDRFTAQALEMFGSGPKHSIVQPTKAMMVKWDKDIADIEADWVAEGPGRAEVLRQYKDLLATVKAGQ